MSLKQFFYLFFVGTCSVGLGRAIDKCKEMSGLDEIHAKLERKVAERKNWQTGDSASSE